jgi:hypothetical protein
MPSTRRSFEARRVFFCPLGVGVLGGEAGRRKIFYGEEEYYFVNNKVIYSVSLDGEKTTN